MVAKWHFPLFISRMEHLVRQCRTARYSHLFLSHFRCHDLLSKNRKLRIDFCKYLSWVVLTEFSCSFHLDRLNILLFVANKNNPHYFRARPEYLIAINHTLSPSQNKTYNHWFSSHNAYPFTINFSCRITGKVLHRFAEIGTDMNFLR